MSFRTLLPLLLFALLSFPSTPAVSQETQAPSLSGEGTAAAPYLISTAEQLREIEKAPLAYYRLERDLSLEGMWTPLCRKTPFGGTLDGNRKEIVSMKIEADDCDAVGLFAQIGESGRVRNLEISGQIRTADSTKTAGAVAGRLLGGAVCDVICRVDIAVDASTPADASIGGLAGYSEGVVFYCEYQGEIRDARSTGPAVGAMIGRTGAIRSTALPKLVTAHAGFGAPKGASDTSEDNTVANIVKALKYRPDVIEVDVQPNKDGVLVITHNKPKASDPALETVLRLLMGELPEGCDVDGFDPETARRTKIQLDAKKDGLFRQELALLDAVQFPYDRVIMAGDSEYETVLANKELIRGAVERGLDFWMNPDRLASYDELAKKSDAFLDRVRALELPRLTVNSYYGAITDEIAEWLAENGLDVSVWTLNNKNAIRANFMRGFKNVTSRLPLATETRDLCAARGVCGSVYSGPTPEIGDVGRE